MIQPAIKKEENIMKPLQFEFSADRSIASGSCFYHSLTTDKNIYDDCRRWGDAKLAKIYYLINVTKKRVSKELSPKSWVTISKESIGCRYKFIEAIEFEDVDKKYGVPPAASKIVNGGIECYQPSWEHRGLLFICGENFNLFVMKKL